MLKMKNILIILLLVILIPATVFAGSGQFTLTQVYYPIISNGQSIDTEDKPVLNLDGSTYLSVRKLSEALGIPILWDDTAKQVKITTCDPAKLAESCVEIYVGNGTKDVEQGSGVLIGYNQILTVDHVTSRGSTYRILYNGTASTGGTLKQHNTTLDMSVLTPVSTDVKPCKIGDSDEVKVGDKVVVINSPKQNKNVVTWGKVIGWKLFENINTIETDIYNNGGGSGGAIFSNSGELLGIMEAYNLNTGTSIYIPINDIRKNLN